MTFSGHWAALIDLTDLPVERAEVIEPADEENTTREEIQDAGEPFAHVKTVEAEDASEGK